MKRAHYHRAKTTDIYGQFIDAVYPLSTTPTLSYDFVFTKNERWIYMSSSDSVNDLKRNLAKPVQNEGEKWRIVEAATGKIVDSN